MVAIVLLLSGCGTKEVKETTNVDAGVCFLCWHLNIDHEANLIKQTEPKGEGEDDGR